MKTTNSQNHHSHCEIHVALKSAFEKGYLLGRDDSNQGVFIDVESVVEQFGESLQATN